MKERSFLKRSRGILVDMLEHICGRIPPGIPLNLPSCKNNINKIIQLYSSFEVVLTFLRQVIGCLNDLLLFPFTLFIFLSKKKSNKLSYNIFL